MAILTISLSTDKPYSVGQSRIILLLCPYSTLRGIFYNDKYTRSHHS